jgi:hypothetical protein
MGHAGRLAEAGPGAEAARAGPTGAGPTGAGPTGAALLPLKDPCFTHRLRLPLKETCFNSEGPLLQPCFNTWSTAAPLLTLPSLLQAPRSKPGSLVPGPAPAP